MPPVLLRWQEDERCTVGATKTSYMESNTLPVLYLQQHPCASVLACTVAGLEDAFTHQPNSLARSGSASSSSSAAHPIGWVDPASAGLSPLDVMRWLHRFHCAVDTSIMAQQPGGLWKFGAFGSSFCVAAGVVEPSAGHSGAVHVQQLLDLVLDLQEACASVSAPIPHAVPMKPHFLRTYPRAARQQ